MPAAEPLMFGPMPPSAPLPWQRLQLLETYNVAPLAALPGILPAPAVPAPAVPAPAVPAPAVPAPPVPAPAVPAPPVPAPPVPAPPVCAPAVPAPAVPIALAPALPAPPVGVASLLLQPGRRAAAAATTTATTEKLCKVLKTKILFLSWRAGYELIIRRGDWQPTDIRLMRFTLGGRASFRFRG
jgi:hypothetical protein